MTASDAMQSGGTPALLTVANGNWGATSLATIRAVLGCAHGVLTSAFGTTPDAPVRVARWDREPRALCHQRPYEIRLNARDRYWCQYIYQFSHELCHVMTGFDRYRDHKHKWFEEAVCETASLFVLHRVAKTWEEVPPPDIFGARDFAANHQIYADNIETGYRRIPDTPLPEWFAANIPRMEADPYRRDLNGVVAVASLDRFREDPSLWRDCGSLNQWDSGADATFACYLDSWAACLSGKGRFARTAAIVREVFEP